MRSTIGAAILCLLASATQASDLASRAFSSPALNGQIPGIVYTSDGKPPEGGWPVLYLLHGHDGNEHSWPDLGHIQATLDRLVAQRNIQPALVVMPGGGNSWYVDSEDVQGPGDFATAITDDLRQAVEAAYPVRTDRGGRAVDGRLWRAAAGAGASGALRRGRQPLRIDLAEHPA